MEQVSVEYAIRHTRTLYVPDRRIDTFGDTRFNFILLSEPPDVVGHCRIRSGWVEAGRPRILRPSGLNRVEVEGFGEEAQRFLEWMYAHGAAIRALLKYGFTFSRSEVRVEYLHESIAEVADRVVKDALQTADSYRAVVQGVDDAWELSLLGFMLEMVQKSHEINIFDFKRRGLI